MYYFLPPLFILLSVIALEEEQRYCKFMMSSKMTSKPSKFDDVIQVWWCDIKQFLSFPKIRSANLCKPIHYIINYSTFMCPFESGKRGKERKNYKILNISRTKKAFFNEIKNTFYNLWRAIIWWKNKNLTKNSRHKL